MPRLFVGGLPHNIDDDALNAIFSRFGTVTYARVSTTNGRSRGYAFVEMPDRFQAANAITEFARNHLRGRKITVQKT